MDRKLIDYIPYVIRDYAEIIGVTEAEQPEFETAWESFEQLLSNQYIDTADNLGLSRWEKILGVVPKGTDSVDARRNYIRARLMVRLPYTLRWLRQWLAGLGMGPHSVSIIDTYTVSIQTHLDNRRLIDTILQMLKDTIPANMCIRWANQISAETVADARIATGVGYCRVLCASDHGYTRHNTSGAHHVATGVSSCRVLTTHGGGGSNGTKTTHHH